MAVRVDKTDAFDAWFATLRDRTVRARVLTRIDRLVLGHAGDTKAVGKGARELRLFFGPGYRIYYVEERDTVVLLLGGDKSSQARDIARVLDMLE